MLLTLLLILSAALPCEATNVGDSLVVGIQSAKTTLLYPLNPQERDILSVYNMVYEGLVSIDDNYEPQPCLCTDWEESGGGKTWTFHLREDVVFSDGTPMTANDVVATANYIIEMASNEESTNQGYYRNLKYFVSSISASGDYTVVVKAARKYYGLLYAMTFPVLKADEVEKDNPVGTGAYKITGFDNSYIWTEVNDLWWQARPQVETVTFMLHSSPAEVIESYQYARVDTIFTRELAASQYKTGTSMVAMDYRTNQLECLIFNESSSPLDDVRVRQAIRYLIDVDSIATSAYSGMTTRSDLPAIPGTWTYNDNLTSWFQQDAEKAQALLYDAGWEKGTDGVLEKPKEDGSGYNRMHLRLFVYEEPENDTRVQAANLISDMLTPYGFEITITTMTLSDISTKLSAGGFDLAIVSYAMDVCPDPGFLLMKSNTGNYMRYNSADMNELFNDLRTQTTQSGYQSTLYKIEELFAQDCPMICFFYRNGAILSRKMFTTARDVRELELMRGIETFPN